MAKKSKHAPRALIRDSAAILKEIFAAELAGFADGMISTIMNRAKKKKDLAAIKELGWPGENGYRLKVRLALSEIASDAVNQARKEVPGARNVKFAAAQITDFDDLPADLQKKLLKEVELLVGTQLSDIEAAIKRQYANSYDTTDDYDLLKSDLDKAGLEYIDGSSIPAGANLVAAKVVNEARNAFFFTPDVLEQVDAFEFYNGDPVTAICTDLAGTVFAKDDPELFRYTPPLHWNCKSYIIPIPAGKLGNREIEPLRPSKSSLEDEIQFADHRFCNH